MRIFGILRFVLLGIYLVFALFPLFWIFLTSIKPQDEIYEYPVRYLPERPTLSNYTKLFSFAKFHRYFLNSTVVSLSSSAVSTFLAILAGYSLSRFKGSFVRHIVLFLFFAQMIPSYLIMIPQYVMFTKFGLIDKLLGVITVYSGLGAAFATIMARGFFSRIPKELEESARIDGCTRLGAVFRVTVPLMAPGISAIFSFCFVNSWNEIFVASLFLNSDEKLTVPVALYSFISKAGIDWGILSAGLIVALIPTILVFAFAQRYIVEGLTQGAVKG